MGQKPRGSLPYGRGSEASFDFRDTTLVSMAPPSGFASLRKKQTFCRLLVSHDTHDTFFYATDRA